MSLTRILYDHSPVFLQDGMVSAYGLYLKRLRYGQEFKEKLQALESTQWSGLDALVGLQRARFAALLDHAYRHVPFYASYLRAQELSPRDITLSNFTSLLPLIEKEHWRKEPQNLVSTAFNKRQLSIVHTSGTTGTPLDVLTTKAAIRENYAFFARFLGWAGVRLGDAAATFAGRSLIPRCSTHPPFWRRNRAMNTTLFSSYHMSAETLPLYCRELERINPVFIDSYPSAIYVLAKHLLENRITHQIHPRAIVTSSETLHEHQRQVIEQAFACRVFDQYGSAEMAAFISQCERGAYHVNPEFGLVELLDANNRPVGPGEVGDLVCTGFLNHASPMLRYRIGDSAMWSTSTCSCGRAFPVIETIVGRTDDILVTPEGRLVGRLDPIFKGLGAIREAQIIQDTTDSVTVLFVREEGYHDGVGALLVERLTERLGGSVRIKLQSVSAIPRSPAGKFRSVVSRVKPRPVAESSLDARS